MEKLKVLFLGARPRDTSAQALKDEVRNVMYRLASAQKGAQVECWDERSVQFADLPSLLLQHQPQIVHFSGHGTLDGHLVFEDASGQWTAIPPEPLIQLFAVEAVRSSVRCAVFNTCSSLSVAEGVVESIDFVVGSNSTIADSSTIAFAESFYQMLAYGERMQDAFDLACAQVRAQSRPGSALPVLFVRKGVDPRTPLLDGKAQPRPEPAQASSRGLEAAPRHPGMPSFVFINHAAKSRSDRLLFEELATWLHPLRRQGVVDFWDVTQVRPGEVAARSIDSNLNRADVVLLLVSADALADEQWLTLTDHAMRRHSAGTAKVIPLLLRPAYLVGAAFEGLRALPANGRALSSDASRSEAWAAVIRELLTVVGYK